MKKYKMIKKDSIEVGSRTLYRVKALKDFGDVKKGDVGGYIEKESNLSHEGDCWVFENALVCDNAKVFGFARVFENVKVFENAWVYGNAKVFDNAWVYGNAKVSDNAWVCGNAKVCGTAICSKTPIRISGLKYDITITDNHVKVGCMQWLKKDVDSVKYKDVKDENITLGEFRKIKKAVKGVI